MMNNLLRGACLAIYSLAVLSLFGGVTSEFGRVVQYVAVIFIAAHLLEVVIAYKSVKLYKGPLGVSIALTLLFGFLHWMSLAKAHARATMKVR